MQFQIFKGATVGAALRGRPWSETNIIRKTGGHGVPPLQLYFLLLLLTTICFARDIHAQKGGAIAYVHDGTEIRLIDPDGANDRRLWTHPDLKKALGIDSLAWRPDGKELAFSSRHAAAASLYDADLYAIRPDGSGLRKLTNAPQMSEFARFPKGNVSVTFRNDQPIWKQSQASAGVFIVYVAGAAEPQQLHSASACGTGDQPRTQRINFFTPRMPQAIRASFASLKVENIQARNSPSIPTSSTSCFRSALASRWLRVSLLQSNSDERLGKHLSLRFRHPESDTGNPTAKRVHRALSASHLMDSGSFLSDKTLDENRDIDLWIARINGANARLLVRNGFSPSWR